MAVIYSVNPKARITLFDRNTEDVVRGSLILKVREEEKKEVKSAGVNSNHPKGVNSNHPKGVRTNKSKRLISPLEIQLQRQAEKTGEVITKTLSKRVNFSKINVPKLNIKFKTLPKLNIRVKSKSLEVGTTTKANNAKSVKMPSIYMRALPSRFTISSNVVQRVGQSLALVCLIISLIGFGSVTFPLVVAETLSRLSKDRSLPDVALAGTLESTPTPIPRKVNPYLDSDGLAPIVNQDFRIIIPSINIESIVIPNVDPLNEEKYKAELKNGVAHARGSYLPGDSGGPIVLFAHSSDIIQNVIQYNAIFYEARNLEVGDEIYIVFNGKRYKYEVSDKKIIDPKELNEIWDSKANLIISTCYPPGSDWKRLLIFGKLVS